MGKGAHAMHRYMLGLIFIAVALIAPVLAAENEPNLCYTTHAGQCQTDTDWQKGWFWANHPPSVSSCALYHQRFTMGDFWGMCNGINQADDELDDGGYSGAGVDPAVEYTHTWHALPDDWSTACPWEGLDPIIDYEDNTFICATDF